MRFANWTVAALVATSLWLGMTPTTFANPSHPGYRDANGVWHNPDGSIPGRTGWWRDGHGVWHRGGGGGRALGWRDAHGVWHNPDGSIPALRNRHHVRKHGHHANRGRHVGPRSDRDHDHDHDHDHD